jgi:hypothetical protein
MGLEQVKQLGAAIRGEGWWRVREYGFPLTDSEMKKAG